MSRKYPRLYRREHTFYMRIAIPRDVQIVALRREFLYSLMTTDYLTAIRLYHISLSPALEVSSTADPPICEAPLLIHAFIFIS